MLLNWLRRMSSSASALSQKKDRSLHYCFDYEELKVVTVRGFSCSPRMDEFIDSLGNAQIFSTLHANCSIWNIGIEDADQDKTALTSHQGLLRFSRVPLGLHNALETFLRAVDVILSPIEWQFSLSYLDDLIIFSRNADKHISHGRTVL